MIIKNASIYTEDHTFVKGNAVVENGRFVSFSDFPEQDDQIVDAQGLYMIPGLVDIHFHGCMGADMCDGTKEALDIITKYEASIGVTSVCPATMTIAKVVTHNVSSLQSRYSLITRAAFATLIYIGSESGRTFYLVCQLFLQNKKTPILFLI